MKKTILFLAAIFILFCGIASSLGRQAVSDEAKRHLDRGMAAMEMAKSPADQELAIKEFEQAVKLAPEWPEAYRQLALAQEKAEKYEDAAASLKQYLRLAPDASDAEAVKSLINKLEFKAEQVITDEDVLDIFVSLTDSSQWQLKGITNANLFSRNIGWVKWFSRNFKPGNQDRLFFEFYSGSCCPTLHGSCPGDALPIGKSIEFETFYCACEDGGCLSKFQYRLEVVSRNKVKMNVMVWRAKEFGGRKEDASYEFVRR